MKKPDYEKMAMDFFEFDFFGFELDADDMTKLKIIFAHRAYRDFCRSLKFCEGIDKNYRYCFRMKIIKDYIAPKIYYLLKSQNQAIFNKRHNEICKGIVTKAKSAKTEAGEAIFKKDKNDGEEFYYGQAQKWLNMTLKYMWIAGALKEKVNITEFLHIPVDSYIIEAVLEKGKVYLPLRADKAEKLTVDKVIPWSHWTGTDYRRFQRSIRKLCAGEGKLPIEWENEMWNKVAKKKNDEKNNSFDEWRKKGRDVIIEE